jgi:hypothetical protein
MLSQIRFYVGGPCLYAPASFTIFISDHQKLAFTNWKSRGNNNERQVNGYPGPKWLIRTYVKFMVPKK